MTGKDVLWQPISERDLDFLVKEAAPKAGNKEAIKQYAREDLSFKASLTANEDVFEAVRKKTPLNLNISPQLYFEILLRSALREMEKKTHTVERSASQKIPVFDLKESLEFLRQECVIGYLAQMLSSFVAIKKETPRDIDIDVLLALGKKAKDQTRFLICKRIADICLFVLGIFPEYVMYDYYYLFFRKPLPITAEPRKSLSEYESLGQEFYLLASKERMAEITELADLLKMFSDRFNQAKKPLNFLSAHYLVFA